MQVEFDKVGRIRNLKKIAEKLTKKDIVDSIDQINTATEPSTTYGESTAYDLVYNSVHYPPKVIFGLALSKLLNFDVQPKHFSGGKGSPCFVTLENLDFKIIPKKIVRETETFGFNNLIVGELYTKLEAFNIANVTEPHQARDISGKTRFQNCVVLFVTLDKQNKEEAHKYNDMFLLDGEQFHWESQSKNTVSTPAINQIINGFTAVLFARVQDKIKGQTQPFVYVGKLEYVEHHGKLPVQVLYNVTEYQPNPNIYLREVYNWNSSQGIDSDLADTTPKLIKKSKRSGQGFIRDAKKKKEIELHAMKLAIRHYESKGYEVIDTSSHCPYDLQCHKEEEFRRVEVKGTMNGGCSVYVTSGEVIDANSDECETDLFIVSNIEIQKRQDNSYAALNGTPRIITNWKPEPQDLTPKTYQYHVPSNTKAPLA